MHRTPEHPVFVPVKAFRLAIAAVCVGCLTFGLASIWRVGLVDDAYIFLVYARNIVEGFGPVFNPGERVEGFTSPLWMFLLAAGGLFTADFESLAYWFGVVAACLAVMLLARQALRTFSNYALTPFVLTAALAASPVIIFWAGSGLDTSLFFLMVSASILSILADDGRSRVSTRTVILLCLATLARPEGTLLAFYAGCVSLWRRRSILPLTGYVAFVASIVVVRYSYYGDFVPNTFHVEVAATFAQRVFAAIDYCEPAIVANLSMIAVLCVLTTFAWRWERSFRTYAASLIAWIFLWVGYVVCVGGDNFPFLRVLVPVIPAMFLLAVASIYVIQRHANRWVSRPVVALSVFLVAISHLQTFEHFAPGFHGSVALANSWGQVGRWLGKNTPPDTVIATPAPGAMAYFSRRVTIDMLGFTDAQVGRHGSVYAQGAHAHARYNTDYIFERKPDLVVYHSSGRYKDPVYRDPDRIHRASGFALFDFVHDPRCKEEYQYFTTSLPDGTVIEMQRRLPQLERPSINQQASGSLPFVWRNDR